MSSGNYQHEGRIGRERLLQKIGLDMTLDVVHPDKGYGAGERKRFPDTDSYQQGTDQSRSGGYCNPFDIFEGHPGLRECLVNDRNNEGKVGSAGQFGDYTPVFDMFELRGYGGGKEATLR
jgi:hypothetical protein